MKRSTPLMILSSQCGQFFLLVVKFIALSLGVSQHVFFTFSVNDVRYNNKTRVPWCNFTHLVLIQRKLHSVLCLHRIWKDKSCDRKLKKYIVSWLNVFCSLPAHKEWNPLLLRWKTDSTVFFVWDEVSWAPSCCKEESQQPGSAFFL